MNCPHLYQPAKWNPPIPVPNPSNYPIDALGSVLAPAVRQHQINTGVAVEMIASYARSVAHVAVQDLVDIQRPRCAPSPVSSFDLLRANSSEGKDTASRPFVGIVRAYEEALHHDYAQTLLSHSIEEEAWKAEMRVMRKRLEKASSEENDVQLRRATDAGSGCDGAPPALSRDFEHELGDLGTSEVDLDVFIANRDARLERLKGELGALLSRRPTRAGDPKVIVDNITPAALENLIADGSKSVFIVSTEAGGLLNGRLGRATDLLNSAWDSTPIVKHRVGEERRLIADYRVSGHFAVQGPVLENIFARTAGLAHGSGLTGRMYLTMAHSTLGNRPVSSDTIAHSDDIERLAKRATELLTQSTARRQANAPRSVITFSSQAATLFDEIYNYIQAHLGKGMVLNDVSGHAGKAAEHIARSAGMLYGIEQHEGPLGVDVLERARQIGFWHLNQFVLAFGKGQPGDQRVIDAHAVADALKATACRGLGYLGRAEVKKWCTKQLSTVRFDRALQLLIEEGYVNFQRRGHSIMVAANWNLLR